MSQMYVQDVIYRNKLKDKSLDCDRLKRISVILPTHGPYNSEEDVSDYEPKKDSEVKTKNFSDDKADQTSKDNTSDDKSREKQKFISSRRVDCPICSESTLNHCHYGGLCCFSCKAFFRRFVTINNKKGLRCRTGLGNCDLRLGRRNNCPACRYQQCRQAGLKPELVSSAQTEALNYAKLQGASPIWNCKISTAKYKLTSLKFIQTSNHGRIIKGTTNVLATKRTICQITESSGLSTESYEQTNKRHEPGTISSEYTGGSYDEATKGCVLRTKSHVETATSHNRTSTSSPANVSHGVTTITVKSPGKRQDSSSPSSGVRQDMPSPSHSPRQHSPSPSCSVIQNSPSPSPSVRQDIPSPSHSPRQHPPSPSCSVIQNSPSPSCSVRDNSSSPSYIVRQDLPSPCSPKTEKKKEVAHQLILSQSASVNLLTVPLPLVTGLAHRIKMEEAKEMRAQCREEVLMVARMEFSFLQAKECVTFLSDELDMEKLVEAEREGVFPALIFTRVQEFFVQLVVIFLKNCPHFQSLTWSCQARLLRKNVAEISIILMVMCFEREKQKFRWRLSGQDVLFINQFDPDFDNEVVVDNVLLAKHLNVKISENIYQVVNDLVALEIPGHMLLLLIVITIFTRDGVMMEKQHKVDGARNHYLQLLFRFIKTVTVSEVESSRLNMAMHRVLKIIKDFAETIRCCEIASVKY